MRARRQENGYRQPVQLLNIAIKKDVILYSHLEMVYLVRQGGDIESLAVRDSPLPSGNPRATAPRFEFDL